MFWPKLNTISGYSSWKFCLAWFGHLSWLVHNSSAATLIQTSAPIWVLQRLFIWLYSINNTPLYAHSCTHIHQSPLDCNYNERTRRRLKVKDLLLGLVIEMHAGWVFWKLFNSFTWSIALPFWVWMMAPLQSDLSVHWSNGVGFIWIKPISLSIVGVCVLQKLHTPTQTLGLLPCGRYPVNHSDCVFLSVSASVLVLAPEGGRPWDSHLTLLLQLQTGRKNGSIDSLRLVGSVSFLCEVCPTFSFFLM